MKRRDFLRGLAGLLGVAVCPTVQRALPAPAEPLITTLDLPASPRTEWYAWSEQGFAVLDNRRVLLGTFDDEEGVVSINNDTPDRPELARTVPQEHAEAQVV